MRIRTLVAASLPCCSRRRCPPPGRRRSTSSPPATRTWSTTSTTTSAPKFEKMNPGVKVRAVGTGPGDAGSQKIYEKLSAQQKAGRGRVGHRRRRRPPARRGDDGEGEAAACRTATTSRPASSCRATRAKNALGANVDGYVLPMFHSQIAFAYNPDLVKAPPKSYRRARRVGEEEPEAVRLQRRQGRHVGRRLRDGLGRAPTAASATSSRRARTTPADKATIDKSLAEPQGLQPERRDDAGQRRHARHAEPRRDRDGPGVGRHVLHVAGRRQDEPEDQARAAVAGPARPADVLRDPGQGRQRRAREEVHRLRGEPGDPGRRHRQAVQLVSGHRSAARAGEAHAGRLEQALHRHLAGRTSRSTAGRSRCRTTSPTSSKATSASC